MKTLKIIIGILLAICALGSLMSLIAQLNTYEAPEIIGHLVAIAFVSWLIYLCFKPSKK